MTWAQIHIASVHLPVIALPVMLSFLAVGLWLKYREVERVALVGLVLVGLITLPIYLTGEEAEHQVEKLSGVYEEPLEEHEDFAIYGLAFALLSAVSAGVALMALHFKPAIAHQSVQTTIFLTFLAVCSLFYTSHLGGRIRHLPEIEGREVTTHEIAESATPAPRGEGQQSGSQDGSM